VPQYVWDTRDPDLDDPLHNPDPIRDAALEKSFTIFSTRGWLNASALVFLLIGLIVLFVGYPVYAEYSRKRYDSGGFNLGGINGTGQIPKFPNMPGLIDTDTPSSAYSRTGSDGKTYNLVFSDEFNIDGRTFWPGDDPFWEAADLHYWCVPLPSPAFFSHCAALGPLAIWSGMTLKCARFLSYANTSHFDRRQSRQKMEN
jgi:hypothetical protein